MKKGTTLKIMRAQRKGAVTYEAKTAYWVVPMRIHEMVDEDRGADALKAIEKQAKIWGNNDPEIVRMRSLIYFATQGRNIKP